MADALTDQTVGEQGRTKKMWQGQQIWWSLPDRVPILYVSHSPPVNLINHIL